MNLNFKPVELHEQRDYRKYLSQCPQTSSDYSFINIWAWAPVYGLEWAWTDSLIWIRQKSPKPAYWAPVGNWQKVDWQKWFREFPELKNLIIRTPEALADIWRTEFNDHFTLIADRDQWDYIHYAKDLMELKGKRFHKKKNLINQFKKKYEYQYLEMSADMVDKALALQDDWCRWRECDSDNELSNENQAILNVFNNWDNIDNIKGGCIIANNIIGAYTIGEHITPETLIIHFEKGCPYFKGIYQAINQMFISKQSPETKWVNRQQDLGCAQLRKAKTSYHPNEFLKKFQVSN